MKYGKADKFIGTTDKPGQRELYRRKRGDLTQSNKGSKTNMVVTNRSPNPTLQTKTISAFLERKDASGFERTRKRYDGRFGRKKVA